ncbi:ABC transporter ATP-binding protein [Paraliobacillus sp. JSM ZJ581]|uniref:ABC transporter ATP-binding protein n=1 Tax=Paraliobacillus sp. JSM ZJ581 TaxID=3342118 RepID=UPI0035A91B96
MSVLKINNLTKKFSKKTILNEINLNITGTYGLLGPNGAGKTTLMRVIATIIEQNSGTITYGNLDWKNPNEVRKVIGYLPQHFSIYPTLSVYDCLNHLAILKGIKDAKKRNIEIDYLLAETNLVEAKHKKINQLSGGMLRRVGIAQALLGNPKILIIDEPTAGLDIEERVRFRSLLRKIGKDKIVIISTHIVEDLESVCDHLCVLKNGEILVDGTIQEVCHYAEGYVWETETTLENMKESTHIISQKSSQKGSDVFRILSAHQPVSDAIQVQPNLEDAYLYWIKGEGKIE